MCDDRQPQLGHCLSEDELSRYVTRQNIAHYRRLTIETTDPVKRSIIWKLLAEEEAKLLSEPMPHATQASDSGPVSRGEERKIEFNDLAEADEVPLGVVMAIGGNG